MRLDLESQKQIRKAAAEVNAYQEVVDVLSNNAAIIAQDYPTIEDGIKSQFMAEKELRMVNASSRGHWLSGIRWENPNFQYGAAYNAWQSYRQSKTANMLFYASLAGKIGPQGAQSFSLHPGTINTNLVNSVLKQDVKYLVGRLSGLERQYRRLQGEDFAQGAPTHVVAALDPDLVGQ